MTKTSTEDTLLKYADSRSLERWEYNIYNHESPESFIAQDNIKKGIHVILFEDIPVELFIDLKPGKPILFMFNGAQQRRQSLKLPVFSGFKVANPDDVSRVFINDPILYLSPNIELGWYAGSSKLNLQKLLPIIFYKLLSKSIPSKKIFAGGSNGGFAAMYYSRIFPGSLAIASNPQINILNFLPGHVSRYARCAFGIQDIESAKEILPHLINLDLAQLYASKRENFVLYIQNPSDNLHIKSHCMGFLEALGHPAQESDIITSKLDDRLFLHIEKWGDGHIGPQSEYWNLLIKNLIKQPLNWSDLFSGGGIENLISMTMKQWKEAHQAWIARQAAIKK